MRLFGLSVTKAAPPVASAVSDNRGWWPRILEPFAGAFQRDIEWTTDTVLAYHAVYACVTLIASDIGKLRIKLVQQDADDIWSETSSPAFSPVLRKPNRLQNHIQFKEWWITCKLLRGNTYALKERDARGIVVALYLLDPTRVEVLVTPDGDVFYKLASDNLAGVDESVVVPASEIIHDRMNCLFHPLVGVSPIFAAGTAANIGIQLQKNATKFFANDSAPGGILTAPGTINQAQAKELKERWQQRERGQIAVLGNGLTFEQLRMTSEDAQMIEHLKWTAETVASVFHVPAFKIGAGTMPTIGNGEILDQRYYSDCLQSHIESFELLMDEGLGIGVADPKDKKTLGVELDLDGLLRMDTATQIDTLAKGIGGALFTPNEARKKVDMKPLDGGDTVYMQQQNYSLAALDERDSNMPFAKPALAVAPAVDPAPPASEPPVVTPPADESKSFDDAVWEDYISDYVERAALCLI